MPATQKYKEIKRPTQLVLNLGQQLPILSSKHIHTSKKSVKKNEEKLESDCKENIHAKTAEQTPGREVFTPSLRKNITNPLNKSGIQIRG